MAIVPEAKVVWQYLRWHGQYSDVRELAIIKQPDFDDEAENNERLSILARDTGHFLRIRFPFVYPPRSYRWSEELLASDILEKAFSNYGIGQKLLTINEIALRMARDGILPAPFGEENVLSVKNNIVRLRAQEDMEDFDAVILCRPTPGLPMNSYRVVEGTKRAIAIRVVQMDGISIRKLKCYLGDYE